MVKLLGSGGPMILFMGMPHQNFDSSFGKIFFNSINIYIICILKQCTINKSYSIEILTYKDLQINTQMFKHTKLIV
jgi:hypothetical protein